MLDMKIHRKCSEDTKYSKLSVPRLAIACSIALTGAVGKLIGSPAVSAIAEGGGGRGEGIMRINSCEHL